MSSTVISATASVAVWQVPAQAPGLHPDGSITLDLREAVRDREDDHQRQCDHGDQDPSADMHAVVDGTLIMGDDGRQGQGPGAGGVVLADASGEGKWPMGSVQVVRRPRPGTPAQVHRHLLSSAASSPVPPGPSARHGTSAAQLQGPAGLAIQPPDRRRPARTTGWVASVAGATGMEVHRRQALRRVAVLLPFADRE